jgi:hypothetical protein
MKKSILSALVIVAFIAGCATFPKDDIKVDAEAAAKANFSGYKTYAWLGSIGIVNDPDDQWEPPQFDADAELVFLINQAMRKRGMTEVVSNPDMLVAYAVGADMAALKLKENPKTKISTLENVPKAGLVVTLTDAQSGFVIWAGVASGDIKNLDAKTAKQRLEYVIKTMFDKLP